MLRKIEQLKNALSDFIEQRSDLVMVLHLAGRYDVVYPLKYLEGLEQASLRDVFLTHGAECLIATDYFDGLMSACEAQIDMGNAVVAAGQGDHGASAEPWSGLPIECYDSSLGPQARLRALVEHIRRYRAHASQRIVLSLLPTEIRDPDGYAALVRELMPTHGYEPWMAGLRIVVRDSQKEPKLVPWLAQERVSGVQAHLLDFGSAALARGILEDARDPSLPPDQRMNALIQLAALDHSYGRLYEAIEKYGVAHRYFVATRNSTMRGVCLLHAGYALEQAGRGQEAWERYRQALEIGLSDAVTQLILNATTALGGMHQRGQQWDEAAKYWEAAAWTAKSMGNGFVQCDAMESWGVCSIALGQVDRALELWSRGTALARMWQYWPRLVSLLEHLVEVEGRTGHDEERRAHALELESARRELMIFQHQHPTPTEAP